MDEPHILDKPIGTTQNGVRYLLSRNEGAQFGWPCTKKKNNPTSSPLSRLLLLPSSFSVHDATRREARPGERASKSKCCGQSVLPSVDHRFFRCRFLLFYRKQVDRLMKLCFACVRSAGVNRAVLFLRASFFSFLLLLLLLLLLRLFLHLTLLILQVAEEVAIPKFLRILSFSSCSR